MTNIADAITGLTTRLTAGLSGTAIGGRVYAFGKDAIDPPAAVVVPAPDSPVVFSETFDGKDAYTLHIKVLVGTQDDRTGQGELLGYMARSGTGSVFAAVAADPTLGGAVAYAVVMSATSYGDIEWAGQIFYGVEFIVECET